MKLVKSLNGLTIAITAPDEFKLADGTHLWNVSVSNGLATHNQRLALETPDYKIFGKVLEMLETEVHISHQDFLTTDQLAELTHEFIDFYTAYQASLTPVSESTNKTAESDITDEKM